MGGDPTRGWLGSGAGQSPASGFFWRQGCGEGCCGGVAKDSAFLFPGDTYQIDHLMQVMGTKLLTL